MELQSFIASGILESYALGQCTDAERVQVERMLKEHPSVQTELTAIELALEQYAQIQAIAPPASLKGRIMDAIQQADKKDPEAPEIEVTQQRGRAYNPWTIAIGLCMLALAGFLWMSLQQIKQQNQQLQQQVAQLRSDLQACNNRTESDKEFVNLLRDADTKRIELDNHKNVSTTVFSSDLRNSTILDLSGVPAPTSGKYLQFWAIVDGKPVSMGMIALQSPGGHQTFNHIAGAQAFAISEEDKPEGNPTPTTVIALGKAG